MIPPQDLQDEDATVACAVPAHPAALHKKPLPDGEARQFEGSPSSQPSPVGPSSRAPSPAREPFTPLQCGRCGRVRFRVSPEQSMWLAIAPGSDIQQHTTTTLCPDCAPLIERVQRHAPSDPSYPSDSHKHQALNQILEIQHYLEGVRLQICEDFPRLAQTVGPEIAERQNFLLLQEAAKIHDCLLRFQMQLALNRPTRPTSPTP